MYYRETNIYAFILGPCIFAILQVGIFFSSDSLLILEDYSKKSQIQAALVMIGMERSIQSA